MWDIGARGFIDIILCCRHCSLHLPKVLSSYSLPTLPYPKPLRDVQHKLMIMVKIFHCGAGVCGMELTASEVDDARAGEVVVSLYPEPALAVPRPVRNQLQGHE